MRVFLAGATGAVGRRLVPRLVERGHVVVGTTRTADKAAELRALGAEPVVVDGLDAAGVGEVVARAEPDAIIHQMTALAGTSDLRRFDRWFARTNELRTRGLENLLAAAQATGVPRVVAQSFTGWNNARTGGPVKTEDDPLDPAPLKWQRESLGRDPGPRGGGGAGGHRPALRRRCTAPARATSSCRWCAPGSSRWWATAPACGRSPTSTTPRPRPSPRSSRAGAASTTSSTTTPRPSRPGCRTWPRPSAPRRRGGCRRGSRGWPPARCPCAG